MRFRVSILGMMGIVAVAALGVVALREGTELWAGVIASLTIVLLLGAILNAVILRGATRAAWGGFAFFGWAFLLWSFSPWSGAGLNVPPSLTTRLLAELGARIHPEPEMIANPKFNATMSPFLVSGAPAPYEPPLILKPGTVAWVGDEASYHQVGHCLGALLFGAFGAAWARFAVARRDRQETSIERTPP